MIEPRTLGEARARAAALAGKHDHVAAAVRVAPYDSASGDNRAAEGNVTEIDSCWCGAERRRDVNGVHESVGRWIPRQPFGGESASH